MSHLDHFRYMESKEPTVFTSSYKDGMERVLQGNFAFLCESSMLDYVVQRDCNLTQIGDWWTARGMELLLLKDQDGKTEYPKQFFFYKRRAPSR